MLLATCPCAFRPHRLAQNVRRDFGFLLVSGFLPVLFRKKIAPATCPCAFRLRRLAQSVGPGLGIGPPPQHHHPQHHCHHPSQDHHPPPYHPPLHLPHYRQWNQTRPSNNEITQSLKAVVTPKFNFFQAASRNDFYELIRLTVRLALASSSTSYHPPTSSSSTSASCTSSASTVSQYLSISVS